MQENLPIKNQIPAIVKAITSKISEKAKQVFLVGGACIDMLQEKTSQDYDIEAYGLSFDELAETLSEYNPKLCGKQFGVIKLSTKQTEGLEIDISIPRKENKIGIGHKDFTCSLDPNMTQKHAAMRRDFTVNSLSICMTGNSPNCRIVDHFGGLKDLENGILRATNPDTFIEDPLRALRAMQLSARKNLKVDTTTLHLIISMKDTFASLSKERVFAEFEKLLILAQKPSIGLQFLLESKWIANFPELEALVGCGQHPEWHPEGCVWTHTLHVADEAAIARESVRPDWKLPFVFGALLHDIGKPSTTVFPEQVKAGLFPKEREWTAWAHAEKGVAPAQKFLQRITNNKELIERATNIVDKHMQPFNLHQGKARMAAYKRLHNQIPLDIIGMMSKCDACGNDFSTIGDPDLEHKVSEICFEYFESFGIDPVEPMILGRHLIQRGYKPGFAFGQALRETYEYQIEDETLSFEQLISMACHSMEYYGEKP